MAGTLERVVKYAVAFQKAWDFLASSDDEDNFFYFFYFSSNYFPRKGSKIWPFLGQLFFLQPLAHAG